jgi:hypothetical protein
LSKRLWSSRFTQWKWNAHRNLGPRWTEVFCVYHELKHSLDQKADNSTLSDICFISSSSRIPITKRKLREKWATFRDHENANVARSPLNRSLVIHMHGSGSIPRPWRWSTFTADRIDEISHIEQCSQLGAEYDPLKTTISEEEGRFARFVNFHGLEQKWNSKKSKMSL